MFPPHYLHSDTLSTLCALPRLLPSERFLPPSFFSLLHLLISTSSSSPPFNPTTHPHQFNYPPDSPSGLTCGFSFSPSLGSCGSRRPAILVQSKHLCPGPLSCLPS
ncbi:uncharacterized protein BO80DRAFT_254877 [Aspergillus ibericus CBS 121593]|uniref:Uncharacterized protein n=1 Tax=Aspergillus ibericus CBS 121593 TaxID=1448316 RepID=A0A395H8U0_9EURO|nr:hypothetical protein BO80DRAFT_254877 [Aspergillus ibericus CBS 121593]RAL04056.1 hypothetical protein BO80DRAFT_254877 [Aspergillus ibericus CBS 121593]